MGALRNLGVAFCGPRAIILAAALVASACSGSAATPSPSTSPSPTPAPTAAPTAAPTKGPATQALTVVGPSGPVALASAAIRCDFPSTSGPLINVIAQPGDPNMSVYVDVMPGSVSVRYDAGSGSTYVERDFAGPGVTAFDAATGATIDSALTETTAPGAASGSLGVLTSIKGVIDCGNQMPGSSTLTLSGATAKGTLSGGLDPVSVECVSDSYGPRVSVIGIATVGSTPTLAVVSISPNTFSLSLSNDGFYRNTATAKAVLRADGATVEGDGVVQNPPAGSAAHTFHMSGGAVCGIYVGG